MEPLIEKKLLSFQQKGRLPSAVLFVNHFAEENLEFLFKVSGFLEKGSVQESLGNALVLGKDPEALTYKVDEVRGLIHSLSLRNWQQGKKRYVLVPYSEKLTAQAANALLKVLEEPPEGTHFFLVAPSRKSLLKTIVSRCLVLVCKGLGEKEKLGANSFYQAFFESEYEGLKGLTRSQISYEFESFRSLIKDHFFEKAYDDGINQSAWFELFDFMAELELKIDANADIKWLSASIERFRFDV